MRFIKPVSYIIGISQLVLGGLFLLVPAGFIGWQGLTPPPADNGYMYAMLAARFLVYGVGMFVIARDPVRHMFWARGMVAIQIIDFLAGLTYVGIGLVQPSAAMLPMTNAAIFAAFLFLSLRAAAPQRAQGAAQ